MCVGVACGPVRIHYSTPTIGGSSGSPVFDADTFTLLGVHHAGRGHEAAERPRGQLRSERGHLDRQHRASHCRAADAGAEAWRRTRRWGLLCRRGRAAGRYRSPCRPAAGRCAGDRRRFAGDPDPGVSPSRRKLLYEPGKATHRRVLAARLETVIGRTTARGSSTPRCLPGG